MDLKQYRESKGLSAKEIVHVIKQAYPGYDRPLNCKVEHPERYGITLCQGAVDLLSAPESFRRPNRKNPRRITFRLTDDEFSLLHTYLLADGYDTIQDGMAKLARNYIKRKERSR